MGNQSTGQEPTTDPQTSTEGTESPAAEKPEKKSEIDQALEAAKGDPAKLAALVESLKADLGKTRKEAGDYRTSKKDLEAKLTEYQTKETERQRAELSELERVKLEKKDLEDKYAQLESRASTAEAKSAFAAAGATDIDSVTLHWFQSSTDPKASRYGALFKTRPPLKK